MHSCAFYMEIPLGNTPIFQIATCSMTKCSASRSINSLVKGEISTAGIISGVGGGGGFNVSRIGIVGSVIAEQFLKTATHVMLDKMITWSGTSLSPPSRPQTTAGCKGIPPPASRMAGCFSRGRWTEGKTLALLEESSCPVQLKRFE